MHQRKAYLPLADADILAHESCFAGQFFDKEDKKLVILPFRFVSDKIEQKVVEMKFALNNTPLDPIMFLTGKTNFRDAIAKKKGYKANRDPTNKPYHLANARAYIRARFNTMMSRGCEADDMLCVAQTRYNLSFKEGKSNVESVICTRDKDLRQCEGWHYGWEVGNQPEFKLQWVSKFGSLNAIYKEGVTARGNPSRRFHKLEGTGDMWLYAQILTGDGVDNIPGLPNMGGGKAAGLLENCQTVQELAEVVKQAYMEVYGDKWEVEMYEQAHLVYMVRELDERNQLIFWRMPDDL